MSCLIDNNFQDMLKDVKINNRKLLTITRLLPPTASYENQVRKRFHVDFLKFLSQKLCRMFSRHIS